MSLNDRITETDVDQIAADIMAGVPWDAICYDHALTTKELRTILQTRIEPQATVNRRRPTSPKSFAEARVSELSLNAKPAKVRKIGRHWYVHIPNRVAPAVVAESFLQALSWADYLTRSPWKENAA